MRSVLATLIWLVDLAIKFALGYLLTVIVWLVGNVFVTVSFGPGWMLAGGILGGCINGRFEGCDFMLVGWAKQIRGDE